MKLLFQGAEAKLYKAGGVLVKDRIKKAYRLDVLDEKLRKRRTRLEISLLQAAGRCGVDVPRVISASDTIVEMEFIDGKIVKDVVNEQNAKHLAEMIGTSIARLHEYNIIHGDITTSNMILHNDKVYFIDFGLGFQSSKPEDKATDLYLLHNAIEAAHWQMLEKTWKIILNAYKTGYKDADKVIKTLVQIEKRGRYKNRSCE
ncbi:MAG: Kae1-associated serine/threonine protein kinase [Candidatus Aenigmarchaeota archaeon]|nr:Kae1-associated serine/threonine protein kinase [Candidatus Aenigmarchaeota archaeon]